MKKFRVKIEEYTYRYYDIEAEDAEKAEELVTDGQGQEVEEWATAKFAGIVYVQELE